MSTRIGGKQVKVSAANNGNTVSVVIPRPHAEQLRITKGCTVEWEVSTSRGTEVLILRKVEELGSAV